MSRSKRIIRPIAVVAVIGLLAGCATVPGGYRDPRDPWESYNRSVHKFNVEFDKVVMKPVARAYRAITPDPLDRGITNFFNNLRDFTSVVNDVLQLKLAHAASDVGRVVVNTTIGLVGFFDVASNMDLPSYKEDFGQTLGYWGLGPGPYFELPILGPSTVADTIAILPDWYTEPLAYVDDRGVQWSLAVLYAVDKRADLLGASKVLEEAALDPYIFTRDAYLQKRRNETYDGNPPLDDNYWPDDQEPEAH